MSTPTSYLIDTGDLDIASRLGLHCHICYDDITSDNMVRYEHDDHKYRCVSTQICGDCLVSMIEAQSNQYSLFVKRITDPQECSKLLKSLSDGTYGIPTRLFDLTVFPHPEKAVIPNIIDEKFGRKNEVASLWLGGESVDPSLRGAPKTMEEVRATVTTIFDEVRTKFADYEGDSVSP